MTESTAAGDAAFDAAFVDHATAGIALWHGVTPPNEAALRMVRDLRKVVADFEALRGALRFEDEPSSFEAALLEAAQVQVRPELRAAPPGTPQTGAAP